MEAVDYLDRGATALLPPPTREPAGQYFELIVRMKEWIPMRGPMVSRGIYSPSTSSQPSPLPEVVRQITWQVGQDRERSRDQLPTWPAVTIEYYEISDKQEWGRVDSAIRNLEARFAHFPFDALGLAATHPPRVEPAAGPVRKTPITKRPRDLHVWMGSGTVDAGFREGVDSGLDSAWDEAWDALSQICQPERQVQGYEANYLIPPERLSELLLQAVNEEQL